MSSFRTILMASVMGASVFVTGCGQAVPGTVTLKTDKPVVLNDADNGSFELKNGPAVLQFKGNLFKPRLEISSAGKAAEFKIPRKVASGDTTRFYLKAEKIEQKVDLEGLTTFESIGMREELGVEGCLAPGWCYVGCYRYRDGYCYDRGGYPGYGSGYGWSNACPGSQRVKRIYEDTHEYLTVRFLDAEVSERTVLGVFNGDRGITTRLTSVQPLEPCYVYPRY